MENYIVLDLEWNQSPSGKEGAVEHLPFEIIEIGAVKLNTEFQIVSRFHGLIKPRVYTAFHFKTSQVVHIDMEELEHNGRDFPHVMEEFIHWCGKDYILCTWGSMDLTELQRNVTYYAMEDPFPKPLLYYDIQKLYSLGFKGGKEKPSLDAAVEEQNIPEDKAFHRALDDAVYTAELMRFLDWDKLKPYLSIDYYRIPDTKEEEVYLEFPEYGKYVSRGFDTKEEALEDKKITNVVCCRCRRMLKKKIRWFPTSQKAYLCLAVCPEHGWIKGKMRIKKSEHGKTYVVKTMRIVGEAGAAEIAAKKEEMKKRKLPIFRKKTES